MDENGLSVRCRIEGCNCRVHGDVRCTRHGGDPVYQWSESAWGTVTYYVKKGTNEPQTSTRTTTG